MITRRLFGGSIIGTIFGFFFSSKNKEEVKNASIRDIRIPSLNTWDAKKLPRPPHSIMVSAHTSNIQIRMPDGYYVESSINRGAIPNINDGIHVYEIAIAPAELNKDTYWESVESLMREKMLNDLEAFKKMEKQLQSDGKIANGDSDIERKLRNIVPVSRSVVITTNH